MTQQDLRTIRDKHPIVEFLARRLVYSAVVLIGVLIVVFADRKSVV